MGPVLQQRTGEQELTLEILFVSLLSCTNNNNNNKGLLTVFFTKCNYNQDFDNLLELCDS